MGGLLLALDRSRLRLPVLGHRKETFWRGASAKVSVRPCDCFFVLESDRLRRVEPFFANDNRSLGVVIGLWRGSAAAVSARVATISAFETRPLQRPAISRVVTYLERLVGCTLELRGRHSSSWGGRMGKMVPGLGRRICKPLFREWSQADQGSQREVGICKRQDRGGCRQDTAIAGEGWS
jgi:hypothetical protein